LKFHPDRWALAFINACGEDAEAGLAALKALLACLSRLPEPVSGAYSARQLERMIRHAVSEAGEGGGEPAAETEAGLETAIRFILLLVKKGRFPQGAKAAGAAEILLGRKKGILKVRVEASFPPEPAFEADLKAALLRKTAASGIDAETIIRPELLGGVRLIIGSEMWDATLRGRVQDLERTLEAAPGVWDGGFG
jgi:F-type H+-transporting ATPase subunit delta